MERAVKPGGPGRGQGWWKGFAGRFFSWLSRKTLIFESRTFLSVNIVSVAFVLGFVYFKAFIEPDPGKTPGDPAFLFRDFLWLFYWRWNLDYLIFPAFLGVVSLSCGILRLAMKRGARKRVLATWIVPGIVFAFSYLYMVGIDLGVTWFADTGLNGTWESGTVLFLGLTAQGLYHTLFFWLIPAVVITALCMLVFLQSNRFVDAFRTLLVSYGFYCLDLGFLDPLVCHLIGLTPEGQARGWYWASFGDWAMGGADKIWAGGWIAHYIILAGISIVGTWIIARVKRDIDGQLAERVMEAGPGGVGRRLRLSRRGWISFLLSTGFAVWYASIFPWLLPVFYFG